MTVSKNKGEFPPFIIDTRERKPWNFSTAETVVRKLDAGDYSIEGYEDKIAVEKKGALTEFAANCHQDRFWRALDRLSEVENPYLVLSFTEADISMWPKGPKGLPRRLWKRSRVKSKFIFSSVKKIEEMGIKVVFCGDCYSAAIYTEQLFNDFLRCI